MGEYYVYILASRKNGTLYVGMTEDIAKRVVRHKDGKGSKFVKKYNIQRLVYFERAKDYREACSRERQLKWWERKCEVGAYRTDEPGMERFEQRFWAPDLCFRIRFVNFVRGLRYASKILDPRS